MNNKLKTVHLIACGVFSLDMQHIAEELKHNPNFNFNLKMTFLPGGLHDRPDELRIKLQSAINRAAEDESCCRVVVGYGICGRGTVGIVAPHLPLIFPKVHDCIAMFMGSDKAYKTEFAKYPGTFYLSSGWCMEKKRDNKIWIGSEPMGYLELKRRYGEKSGGKIIDFFTSWQKNYQRAAFIDTGLGDVEKYAQSAKDMATEYAWKYERIKGDSSLMERLLTQEYSDDTIVVVPPNYCTIYSALKNSLDFAPKQQGRAVAHSNSKEVLELNNKLLNLNSEELANQSEELANQEENKEVLIRYGLGIDAGGTYTDAVIYDFCDKKIVCKNKALTTKWDFSVGIQNALLGLNGNILSQIELVSISTTLATNAIVEGEGQKTGLIVMNSAGVVSDDLIVHNPKRNIKGYINISGEEIEPVDEDEVRDVLKELITKERVTAFAVSGFGGSINPAHELIVKQIVEQETGMVACCGHELSDQLNFVVRAQTAVLNARIIPRMIKFFGEISLVLNRAGVTAPIMVVKGDGTLISSDMARERPVETILSGPAASVAGAKILTGLRDAIVVDMGGTTTDTADICDNTVAVCESGAWVGGVATHVKALDMRTAALGGDSLIRWKQGGFTIGPRRVAPLVWAGSIYKSRINQALFHMEQRSLSHLEQVIFVATDPIEETLFSKKTPLQLPFKLTDQETQIYELLKDRPYTPEELAASLNCLSTLFLPMERLEESGVVQRCGLTPTDLLHINGAFKQWDSEPAKRVVHIMAQFTKKEFFELTNELLEGVERRLALELLKNLIFKDIDSITQEALFSKYSGEKAHTRVKKSTGYKKGEVEMELENSYLARHLVGSMLEPSLSSRYKIKAHFCHPIVGIGAPIHYFLPKAGERLNAKVIVPDNADVANALGAITSHIMIEQKVTIRPDSIGRFIVEGVAGHKDFDDVEEAKLWAIKYLKRAVREQAIKAGTYQKEVLIDVNDRVVNTGNGVSLFLDRTIKATLKGVPDVAFKDKATLKESYY